MSLEAMKSAMLMFMESGVDLVQEKINALTDEEKNELASEDRIKDLQTVFADKNTATFLTKEDHLNIALLLAKRGVIAMKKQMEEESNGK